MCWNQDVSINTFVFSLFALIFIFFSNTFTKYKVKEFENPIMYVFLLEVVIMQLIEFFLWRNLKNKSINNLLSKVASFFVTIQPVTIMLMIPNLTVRYIYLFTYSIFVILYFVYKELFSPIHFNTSVGKNGHLSWEWMNFKGYENIFYFIYLLFYVLALLSINNLIGSFIIFFLILSLFIYLKNKTFSSMWCWLSNFILLYFIIVILIINPFYEYNMLC